MKRLLFELEDQLMPPLEPLTVMPVQYGNGHRYRAQSSEMRLMYAILEDAMSVYCNFREPSTAKHRRNFRNARRWIDSSDRTWMFSFLRICEALDLNPEYIRRGLRARRALRTGEAPAPRPLVRQPAVPEPVWQAACARAR